MKFLKLSLAASVALGAFSTASFAQPLEDAIKGIDVSGYLRYRFNSDYYDNGGNNNSNSNNTHRWKAVADFKAPVADNVAFNFGILYNNESNNVQGTGGLGSGLGSGKDGSFGVSTFNAVITPDSTATTVIIGKQRLATPVTNAGDDDRGTGILALNSDLEGFTFAAGAFDSWSIDDLATNAVVSTLGAPAQGYNSGDNNGISVTKPLYVLAGIYGVDTDYGHFGAQLWGFYIQDIVDGLGFGELSWTGSTFNAALQYAIASLNNDAGDVLSVIHPNGNPAGRANIPEANDLFVLNLGADFAKDFGVPLDVKLGWVTNFQDGTAVTLNDDGTAFKYAGAIWWQNNATGFSTSALLNRGGYQRFGNEQEVSVFYGAIGYSMVDSRLRIGLDYVWGNNEITTGNATLYDIDFQEITPRISWKHNKNLTISGYYAYLMTDGPNPVSGNEDQDRARARVEVKYSF
ncbi:major outer membrane protein [Helicobacter sp. UBA3407]|uniref:major outer membrane protein n=1 Tax=Helicobacter sp. UBA3407 TaxID=1946588 RepID=UPI0026319BC0|nr:major outer membrane protein [Helicobacter sp. UBA3407]